MLSPFLEHIAFLAIATSANTPMDELRDKTYICHMYYHAILPSVHISLLCYHNLTVNHFPSETAGLQTKIPPAWKKFKELQAETT